MFGSFVLGGEAEQHNGQQNNNHHTPPPQPPTTTPNDAEAADKIFIESAIIPSMTPADRLFYVLLFALCGSLVGAIVATWLELWR